MEFKKASRKKSKLRLNISAPSGAGKTYSSLLLAKGLVGDWDKIGVIDTENDSASLYEHLGPFNTLVLTAPFTPERYIEAINAGVNAGFECIIIDSSSHEWDGPGGCVEANERLAQARYKGNTWSAWNETTPRHDAFVEAIKQCPAHVITCTRSKMETVMGEGKKVHKVGMKDIQRSGWEYELTLSLNLDRETHTATASKDRTELFEGADPFVITEKTGEKIKEWCEKGVDVAAEARKEREQLEEEARKAAEQLVKDKKPLIKDMKAILLNSLFTDEERTKWFEYFDNPLTGLHAMEKARVRIEELLEQRQKENEPA